MSAIISRAYALKGLAAILCCAVLSSFTSMPGGEGFEVFLNNKVVLQQFGSKMNTIKTLNLDQASPDDQLAIIYHHCGQYGKNRVLTIKDGQNNTLKKWNFKDEGARMTCKVKDILNLQKKNAVLKLYYSSSELPEGRQLALLSVPAGTLATR
jgi:hypothetical protein